MTRAFNATPNAIFCHNMETKILWRLNTHVNTQSRVYVTRLRRPQKLHMQRKSTFVDKQFPTHANRVNNTILRKGPGRTVRSPGVAAVPIVLGQPCTGRAHWLRRQPITSHSALLCHWLTSS